MNLRPKAKSLREEILQIALPSLVIIVAYTLFFYRAETQTLSRLQGSLQKIKSEQPSFIEIQGVQRQQKQKQKEEVELKQSQEQLKRQKQKLATSFAHSRRRAENFDRLNLLLQHHDLIVIETEQDNKRAMTPQQRRFIKALDLKGKQSQAQLWNISVIGAFPKTVKLLESIKESHLPIYVVGLGFKADSQRKSKIRTWVLTVWI